MIHLFLGTDTKKALEALSKAASQKKMPLVRITDASSLHDLEAALGGGGMFGEKNAVILDRLSDNDELWSVVLDRLPVLSRSEEAFYIYEVKPLAAVKKQLEKAAKNTYLYDVAKGGKERPSVFGMVNSMRACDKKNLWVAYQKELASGNAPEAIHGVLFWGAKQAFLGARSEREKTRAKQLLVQLTELPHESRRKGEELEYALERFVLCV